MDMPIDLDTLPYGEAISLSPLVRRILAPNASAFTYTGTETYVVGTTDLAVIDPGPADADHIDAIARAIDGRPVRAIMCTHTHRDHSPAAAPLAVRTGAPIIGCAPLTLEDDGPRADAAFDPDYRAERILGDGDSIAGMGWTLRAVATPGHTSNHLCFALEEEKALFTGDHVMGWSTTVVSPPDGDMADYMASLARMIDRDDTVYYPAHGDPIHQPQRFTRGLLGHRKQREGQILREIERGVHLVPDMVTHMYKGVDTRLHPAAGRSVLAHLIDLEQQGRVRREDEQWNLTQ